MNRSWKMTTAFILALALLLPASRALANVAANTKIFTEATLTYDDGTGAQTSKASVTVTVAPVPALAVLSEPNDQSAVYGQTNTATGYSYTVTAGGNGPDTYTLAIATANATNTSGNSAQIKNITSPVTLGATVTTVGSTNINILVPSDGVADTPGSVNGIEAGDFVLVNSEVREVQSVADPATGTATIVLKTSLSAAPGAGVSVWEQKTFDVEVFSGTIATAGQSIVLTVETSVTNSAGKISDQVVNTFTSGAAVLTKFARNLTNASANSGGTGGRSFTINGSTATYFTGGLTATANDEIQYILLVENAGTAPVTGCDIQDLLPLDYVNFLTGLFSGKDVLYVDEAGTETGLTAAADTDTATVSGADMTFNIGTGATSSATGSIDAGKNIKVVYRVQVK
jgi:uncharacterized repeat protein (TIGR01451 family)